MRSHILLVVLLWLVCGEVLDAQEWTRFRGPNGAGIGDAPDVPSAWTDANVKWKTAIPGEGHSSPVLWGERVFLTSADPESGKRLAICVDAHSGKLLWSRDFPGEKYHTHKRNSMATSTPVVDAQHVYLAWALPEQTVLMALKHDGTPIWQAELGPFDGGHGFGVSPVIVDNLVILICDQDEGGKVHALDTATGKVRWQVTRRSQQTNYATPCLFQATGHPAALIVSDWKHGVSALDPRSGATLWELDVFDLKKKERSIVSPLVAGDRVLATCGFVGAKKHFVAVRPGDVKSNQPPSELWRFEKAVAHIPTPVVIGSRVYVCNEAGIATCLNVADGEQIWQERLGGNFSASLVATGDRIFCTADNGEVIVLRAADTFTELGRSHLGEVVQATPAIAHGRIYFRTAGHLIAVGK